MYELIYSQENMCVISLLIGVLMGASYDIIRGLRRVFRHRNTIICIEDFLYWAFWTVTIIYVVQNHNNGILRLYIFLAMLIGLILYMCTISRLYLFLLLKIINFIKKIVKKANIMLKSVVKKVRIKPIIEKYRKTNGDR